MTSDTPKTTKPESITATTSATEPEQQSVHWSVGGFAVLTIVSAVAVGLYSRDIFIYITMACGIAIAVLVWRYLRDPLVVLVVSTLVFGAVLGWGMNFYDNIVWYDDLVHFAFSLIGVMAIARLTLSKFRADSTWILLLALWFGWLGIGSLWELGEWISDQLQASNHSRGYVDTMADMILNSAGAAVGTWMYWVWFRRENEGILLEVER